MNRKSDNYRKASSKKILIKIWRSKRNLEFAVKFSNLLIDSLTNFKGTKTTNLTLFTKCGLGVVGRIKS